MLKQPKNHFQIIHTYVLNLAMKLIKMDFKPFDQGLKFLEFADFISFHLCFHVLSD